MLLSEYSVMKLGKNENKMQRLERQETRFSCRGHSLNM